jgi:hypothetical protein
MIATEVGRAMVHSSAVLGRAKPFDSASSGHQYQGSLYDQQPAQDNSTNDRHAPLRDSLEGLAYLKELPELAELPIGENPSAGD